MPGESPVLAFETERHPRRVATSERIRARLQAAGERFFANDSIAGFIEPGELGALHEEVAGKLEAVLQALVIDTEHDHNTRDTARRVARMFIEEAFRGRYAPAPEVTDFANVLRFQEMVVVGPITVRSTCAHHLCPITGHVWIGVLPHRDRRLIGLSKYTRICDWVMRRPQIQEEAVVMLADELERRVEPRGLAVLMKARHFCTHWRGVKDEASLMQSTVMRGAFSHDADLRREFLDLARTGAD